MLNCKQFNCKDSIVSDGFEYIETSKVEQYPNGVPKDLRMSHSHYERIGKSFVNTQGRKTGKVEYFRRPIGNTQYY